MELPDSKKKQIARIARSIPGAGSIRVVVFGSQARGDSAFGSDIDVGIERADGLPLRPGVLADIQEAFDESSLEERVEVVDIARASGRFRSEALQNAVAL